MIKTTPNGRDNKLFSNTMEASLRDPDLVNFFASSMIRLSVSCKCDRAKSYRLVTITEHPHAQNHGIRRVRAFEYILIKNQILKTLF